MKPEPNQEILCSNCGRAIRPGARHCSGCGTRIATEEDRKYLEGSNSLKTLLWLYGSLLIFIGILRLLKITSGASWSMTVDILFSIIILVFAIRNSSELRPLYKLKGLNIFRLVLVAGGAVVFAMLVIVFSDWLQNSLLHSQVYNEEYLFTDTAYPLLFSILSIAVQPALFEEMGFRGLIYNQLFKAGGPTVALLVSSFMFAILHLSVISLLWIVPIGIVFGWLRQRYNTLWYGMIGHFIYNSTIVCYYFYSTSHSL